VDLDRGYIPMTVEVTEGLDVVLGDLRRELHCIFIYIRLCRVFYFAFS